MLDEDGFVQRVAGVFPALQAAAQWADALDAEAVELERYFGAGLFAGTGAVEDDVAVGGDDLAALL